MKGKVFFLIFLLFLVFACRENHSSGSHKLWEKNINIGNVKEIKSKISFKAGELNVHPVQEDKIIQTSFAYFREKWKPEVNYEEDSETGYLDIFTRGSWDMNMSENDRIAWNIGINKNIRNDLFIKAGAGKFDIDLHDCNIRRFDLDMGAGEAHINLRNASVSYLSFDGGAGSVEIDLSGQWHNDLNADVEGGVGEITLILPSNIGIELDVSGILGERDIPGFYKDGNLFTNELNGTTQYNLFINVNGGIGTVKVITN